MTASEERLNELFEEHVPDRGRADTLGGEIVRAVCRIGYRNYNDGDHIGIGYGRETVSPAARFLAAKCDGRTAEAVNAAWGVRDDGEYDALLEDVMTAVVDFLDAHPETFRMENTEDMWDYRDAEEDVDTCEDEEEEWSIW